jgi:hypothetical protein
VAPHCDTANERLRRWVEYEARRRAREMGVIVVAGQEPMLFVGGEVLVGHRDRDLITECLAKGGEIVPPLPLGEMPDEVRRTRELNPAEFPMPIQIRFAGPVREERPESTLPELHERWRKEGPAPRILVSDPRSASLASFVGRHAAEGRNIILNAAGSPTTLPVRDPREGLGVGEGDDPGAWASFGPPANIVKTWQLVESVRLVRSLEPVVWIAILDTGFRIGPNGEPLPGDGETDSDFGLGVPGVNIIRPGTPVGGPAVIGSTRFHGHGSASVAAALVGNKVGAAGTGGTVARPFFFHIDCTMDHTLKALRYVTAWGLDIASMSYRSIVYSFLGINDVPSDYDECFQFAHDHGVICITGAGNDEERLPDLHVRPATRTPGVITVGALDGGDARPNSNYGSSVDIWAPGTNIPIAPHETSGATFNDTSAAAPFVAGVAAMMRAVDPLLHPAKVKEILVRTGWPGTPGSRVSKGLDAYAAVLDVLGGTLPADLWEPNQTAATAAPLYDMGGGVLRPLYGFATRARGDVDYWKFELKSVSDVTVTLDWYARLGHLSIEIESTDADDVSAGEMTASGGPGTSRLAGTLSPGTYVLRVTGSALTAYELKVTPKPATIREDIFEPNDSFEGAAPLHFEPLAFPALRAWGPGDYQATLHRERGPLFPIMALNEDYFELNVPPFGADLRQSQVVISGADQPIDIELFDESRQLIESWPGRKAALTIKPPPDKISYLKISGTKPTRYRLGFGRWVDPSMLPDEIEDTRVLPPWWEDPRFALDDPVVHFGIDVNPGRDDGRILLALPGEELGVELLDMRGTVVGRAVSDAGGRLEVATDGLETGSYLMRVKRAPERAGVKPELRFLPPLRFR